MSSSAGHGRPDPKNRGQLTRWYAMHLPRPPVPAWPARAPPILLRPTSPPVRDHRKRNLPSTNATIVALVTTDCTRYHRPHPQPTDHLQKHRNRPKLPRNAQFRPATRLGAKNPKLEADMLLQNARTSCRRPTPPQMPPPSPRADNFDRPLGNISASRGTWLAPPTAP